MSPSCFIAPFVVKIFLQPLRDAFSLPLTPLKLCRQSDKAHDKGPFGGATRPFTARFSIALRAADGV